MRIPFEPGDDQSNHRNLEIAARQIDGDDALDAASRQPAERPAQILGQIVGGKSRRRGKQDGGGLARQRVEQRLTDVVVGRRFVLRRRKVVADAGDIGEPGLRRLGQRAG